MKDQGPSWDALREEPLDEARLGRVRARVMAEVRQARPMPVWRWVVAAGVALVLAGSAWWAVPERQELALVQPIGPKVPVAGLERVPQSSSSPRLTVARAVRTRAAQSAAAKGFTLAAMAEQEDGSVRMELRTPDPTVVLVLLSDGEGGRGDDENTSNLDADGDNGPQ